MMRSLLLSLLASVAAATSAFAGAEAVSSRLYHNDDAQMPSFEMSAESAYLLGIIGNPNSYEIGAQFITARWRWGANHDEQSFWHGFNQVYLLAMGEPIFRGVEDYYFGISTGFRYNWVRTGSRFVPYFSGGVGMGYIDAHPGMPGAQGQHFTFNILSGAGVSYRFSDHWKGQLGILYEHFSNGGQTDPNPSLNLLGPQIGVTYSW